MMEYHGVRAMPDTTTRLLEQEDRCEFCGRDPYHYVDIGVGYEAVAIVCCDEAIEAYHAARDRARAASATGQSNG